jgi:hypothetical protein
MNFGKETQLIYPIYVCLGQKLLHLIHNDLNYTPIQ